MAAISGDQLRELQAPLKERYRDNPESALITLEADGTLDEGISCSVSTGQALVRAGLHSDTGGDGSLACSGDMLLQALAACAGVTMRSVATAMEIEVSGTVHAEGDLDWRGTLAVDKEAPVGFKAIRMRFDLQSDASDEQLETLQRLTERYCVVLQTLASSPELSVSPSGHERSGARRPGRPRLDAGLRPGQGRDRLRPTGGARGGVARRSGFEEVSPSTVAVGRIAGIGDLVLGVATLAALEDRDRLRAATARQRRRRRRGHACVRRRAARHRSAGRERLASPRRCRLGHRRHLDGMATELSSAREREVLERIRRIPEGHVTTYGDLSPGAPRFAGQVLSACHDPSVPWQRVVRADGSLAKGDRQRRLLEAEGVQFKGARVDMEQLLDPGRRPRLTCETLQA